MFCDNYVDDHLFSIIVIYGIAEPVVLNII